MNTEPIEVIEYKGFNINIHPDYDAQCPHDKWDSEPPLAAMYYEHGRPMYSNHGIVFDPCTLETEHVRKHWREMVAELGYSAGWKGLRHMAEDLGFVPSRETLPDFIADCVYDYVEGMTGEGLLEAIERTYFWAGHQTLLASVTGHTQTDYAELLLVASDEWLESSGVEESNVENALKESARLFGQWSFGDVYGYTVTKTCKECGNPHAISQVPGCWGFYGDDHKASGLLDMAQGEIDVEIAG